MPHEDPHAWPSPSGRPGRPGPTSSAQNPGVQSPGLQSPGAQSPGLPPSDAADDAREPTAAPVAGSPTASGSPTTTPRPSPRRGGTWALVGGTAVVSALVASVATVGILTSSPEPSAAPQPSMSLSQVSDPAPTLESVPSWQEVVDAVAPSVVAISVDSRFGGSQGSGVIIDTEGLVLTNNHVVETGVRGAIDVVLHDGRVLAAEIVGLDATTDLAVLRLVDPPADLQAATLGDSDAVRVGQPVMAVGNPLGLAGTVTTGVVSAVDRPTVTRGAREPVVVNAIQLDAAVNPGNSGGPLFDAGGRVIGINSSIATLSGGAAGSIGLGFAIPVNLAKHVAEQLVDSGRAQHAFLGVTLADGTAEVDGVVRQGAVVGDVVPGSPAQEAGLAGGDVIIAIDGRPVASGESLTGYVRARAVGQESVLTYVRDGVEHEVTVTLAARDEGRTVRG